MADFPGPTRGRILLQVPIPINGSVVTASDGTFRIAGDRRDGVVLALSTNGKTMWMTTVDQRCSAPMALLNGVTVVTGFHSVNWIGAGGEVERITPVAVNVDDSGGSPNVTADGTLVLGACNGEVVVMKGDCCWQVGVYGYDVLPPAVYRNRTLGVGGYAGTGPSRVTLRGETLWSWPELYDVDGIVSLNQSETMAVSAANRDCTYFLDSNGALLSRVKGTFACGAHRRGWTAFGKNTLCLLSEDGQLLWQQPLDGCPEQGRQAASDSVGNIYASSQHGMAAFNEWGVLLFETRLAGPQPDSISLIGQGRAAFVCHQTFYVLD